MTKKEKIIKRIYEDGNFPLAWADIIRDALIKETAIKVESVKTASNGYINCICPKCGNEIILEPFRNNVYCESCGQLLER